MSSSTCEILVTKKVKNNSEVTATRIMEFRPNDVPGVLFLQFECLNTAF